MIYLGRFTAGDTVFYAANFHSDQGTLVDPTSPTARTRNPAGTWSDLTAPAKQDTKTGFYGGTVDTTGLASGQHIIRMAGTVATAKDVATVFAFEVGPVPTLLTGDAYARIGAAGASLTAVGDMRLASLDAAVSTRLATAGYTAPLDAAGTRTAIGLASANLDTQLAALGHAALLDLADGVETGITLRQAMRVALAALAGKADGGATTTVHYRNQADTKNRITATVAADDSGDRTAITLDLT